MASRKKRILWVGEFHKLATGYAVYANDFLHRLQATGLYEIAELACGVSAQDIGDYQCGWRVYPNRPPNHTQNAAYQGDMVNEFGKWIFTDVVLDFQPDIICTITDVWMWSYIIDSPLRAFYKVFAMPAVDATPQNEEWLYTYGELDGCFTYTDWATDVLKEQGGGKIPLRGIAPPCPDLSVFRPTPNKAQHKVNMGVGADSIIVGTVMRNQKRKLFPNLVQDFSKMLENHPNAANLYLYLHCQYPDIGWNIPEIILNSGIGHKILLTYKCINCNIYQISLYEDVRKVCPKCKQAAMKMPGPQSPVSNDELNSIYNVMDVYVQYSSLEGIGMPQAEAAACGVPVMTLDYSGMVDIINKLGAVSIPVLTYTKEPESGRLFAYPDDKEFARLLAATIDNLKEHNPYLLRSKVATHYNWDNVARQWITAIESVDVDAITPYNVPPRFVPQVDPRSIPQNLPPSVFVANCLQYLAGRPDLINKYQGRLMAKYAEWGCRPQGFNIGNFISNESWFGLNHQLNVYTKDMIIEQCVNLRNYFNEVEQKRVSRCCGGQNKDN